MLGYPTGDICNIEERQRSHGHLGRSASGLNIEFQDPCQRFFELRRICQVICSKLSLARYMKTSLTPGDLGDTFGRSIVYVTPTTVNMIDSGHTVKVRRLA